MSGSCPICQGAPREGAYETQSPVFWVSQNREDTGRFEDIRISQCSSCGHVWMPHVNPDVIEEIYEKQPAPNAPVSDAMYDRYNDLVEFLGKDRIKGKDILEVGGGTGSLARIFSRFAEKIVIVEPNHELPKLLSDKADQITIINGFFDEHAVSGEFDYVVCRQVLEHIVDISAFSKALASSVRVGGYLYIEVPDVDFIFSTGAYMDIHVQHIHYFSPACLACFFSKLGFRLVEKADLMGGHDFGLLLEKVGSPVPVDRPSPSGSLDPSEGKRLRDERFLEAFAPNAASALYGASAQGVVFYQGTKPANKITRVFDDNPSFEGGYIYNAHQVRVVQKPNADDLRDITDVFVGPYIHEKSIAEKLRKTYHYTGNIWSTNPANAIIEKIEI